MATGETAVNQATSTEAPAETLVEKVEHAIERGVDVAEAAVDAVADKIEEKIRTVKVGDRVLYRVPVATSVSLSASEAMSSNGVKVGDVLPGIVVRSWDGHFANLRVYCDGPVDAWVTSAHVGSEPGQFEFAH